MLLMELKHKGAVLRREIRSTGPRPGDAHPFRRSGQLAPVAGDAPGASTPPRRREPGR